VVACDESQCDANQLFRFLLWKLHECWQLVLSCLAPAIILECFDMLARAMQLDVAESMRQNIQIVNLHLNIFSTEMY
jgi:hypothetical protein